MYVYGRTNIRHSLCWQNLSYKNQSSEGDFDKAKIYWAFSVCQGLGQAPYLALYWLRGLEFKINERYCLGDQNCYHLNSREKSIVKKYYIYIMLISKNNTFNLYLISNIMSCEKYICLFHVTLYKYNL